MFRLTILLIQGGTCGAWTKNTCDFDVDECVRKAAESYHNPSEYRLTQGPNSNTFAATIAKACQLKKPDVSDKRTPGWDHDPAPPKGSSQKPAYRGGPRKGGPPYSQ